MQTEGVGLDKNRVLHSCGQPDSFKAQCANCGTDIELKVNALEQLLSEESHSEHLKSCGMCQNFVGEGERLRVALQDLEIAECRYRAAHGLQRAGHQMTGYCWDQMRRAGDRARVALKGTR